jgi:hypothetical protein
LKDELEQLKKHLDDMFIKEDKMGRVLPKKKGDDDSLLEVEWDKDVKTKTMHVRITSVAEFQCLALRCPCP